MSLRSTPDWAAILRASGDTLTRSVLVTAGAPAGGGAGVGAGADGVGGRSRAPASPRRGGAVTGEGSGAIAAGFAAGGWAAGPLAGAAALSTLEMSSSASAITPMRAPTGASCPGWSRIFRRTPPPNASISTSALSVSTSARPSPPSTRPPSFLSHLMSLPVSMASESFGITTRVTDMSSTPVRVAGLAHGFDDPFLGRSLGALEVPGVRHRGRGAGDPLDRSVEVIESVLGDERGDLRAHSGKTRPRLDYHR